MSSQLAPCQCGYGDNWYCNGEFTQHEYNTGDLPMAHAYKDRRPLAAIYGHISEKYVVAHIYKTKEEKFKCNKSLRWADAQKEAFNRAAAYINGQLLQSNLF